jgi:hypothetical protein
MGIYNPTIICHLAHGLECWPQEQGVMCLNPNQVRIITPPTLCEDVDRLLLAQDTVQWQALVVMVMNLYIL